MNTNSHLLMGRLLRSLLLKEYGFRLNAPAFLLGSTIPDFLPSLLFRPHYLCCRRKYLQNMLSALFAAKNTAWNDRSHSFRFGLLCHFYADFFCYAHSDFFRGNLAAHIRYEAGQNRYFKEHIAEFPLAAEVSDPFGTITAPALYRRFDTLHTCYLGSRNSFGNDLAFTVMACTEAAVLLSRGAEQSSCAETDGICMAV